MVQIERIRIILEGVDKQLQIGQIWVIDTDDKNIANEAILSQTSTL